MQLIAQINSAVSVGREGLFIDLCKKYRIHTIAVHIRKNSDHTLYLSFPESSTEKTGLESVITFEELCRFLSKNQEILFVHCILKNSNLEMDIKATAIRYEVFEQIIYNGKINPIHISKWDREKIHYDAENCLPGIYETDDLKKAHFDVIHYFCRKYSISTIQLRADFLTEEIQEWCRENELSLALWNPSTVEEIHDLKKADVKWISADSELVFDYQKKYANIQLLN